MMLGVFYLCKMRSFVKAVEKKVESDLSTLRKDYFDKLDPVQTIFFNANLPIPK
jgi:hypothetical protein